MAARARRRSLWLVGRGSRDSDRNAVPPARLRAGGRSARRARSARPVQTVPRGRDDAVPSAAAHSQEQIGLSFSLAVSSSPSAVTRSTERRLSTVAPYLRINQPIPPPKVSPETPVLAHDSTHRRKPKELRLAVELAPQHACFGAPSWLVGRRECLSSATGRSRARHRRPHARRPRGHLSGRPRADHARVRSALRRRRRRRRRSAMPAGRRSIAPFQILRPVS